MIKKRFSYKKYLYSFVGLGIFIFLLSIFHQRLAFQSLCPASIAHCLQTDAFLQGKLFLSSRPFGILWDFIYTERGMHQNWGLGVPLLKLPFECIAKMCKFYYFPSRVIALFYIALMIVVTNFGLKRILSSTGLATHHSMYFIIRWGLIAWFLFSPLVSGLIHSGFCIYEETIFYVCLYSVILLTIFWIYIQRPHYQTFIVLCLISGLAWLIRPTLIFYGAVTAGIAIVFTYQNTKNIRLVVIGIFCFLTAMFINLIFNYLRFGAMLEFGYTGSISSPELNYGQRFHNPFFHTSVLAAAKELIYALFLNQAYTAREYARYREYLFPTCNISHLAIVITGMGTFFFIFLRTVLNKKYSQRMNKSSFRIVFFSLAWGSISSLLLFMFYLYTPGITSRYLSEFSAAFYALFIALILFCLSFITSCFYGIKKIALLVLFLLGVSVLFYINNKGFFQYQHPEGFYAANKEDIAKSVFWFNRQISYNPPLPEVFYCGRFYHSIDSGYQFSGWNISSDCLVSYVTAVFMPTKQCVTINYSILEDPSLFEIRIKRGLLLLRKENSPIIKNVSMFPNKSSVTERYCSEKIPSNTLSLYSIGWVKADKFKLSNDAFPVKVRLNWISVNNIEENHVQ